MRLPVDTSVVRFVSAGPAEPSLDFDTKQQKAHSGVRAINDVAVFHSLVAHMLDLKLDDRDPLVK